MADPKLSQNIIKLLGLEALPDEEKARLVERMAALVERRLTVRLAKELSDADAATLESLGPGSEAATAFLRDKFSNLDAMALEEIENVKREAVEAAKAADGQ